MLDKELMEQFQMLMGAIERVDKKVGDTETHLTQRIKEEVRESETRTKVFIENQVSDKIKGLFDGYKAALENQALLELANKTLVQRLGDVESRLSALEDRTA